MTIEAKTCKNCGLTKDLIDFRKDPNNKSDGHRGTCKSCETIKRDMKRAMKVDEWESSEALKERIRPMLQGLTQTSDEEGAPAPSAIDWKSLRDIVGEPPPREDSEEPAVTEEELNQILRSNPSINLSDEETQLIRDDLLRSLELTKQEEKSKSAPAFSSKSKVKRASRERFNMRWNPEEIKELEQFSEKQDLSMSQTVRRAVRYYLAEVERLGHLP